jgi:hypothetical protein
VPIRKKKLKTKTQDLLLGINLNVSNLCFKKKNRKILLFRKLKQGWWKPTKSLKALLLRRNRNLNCFSSLTRIKARICFLGLCRTGCVAMSSLIKDRLITLTTSSLLKNSLKSLTTETQGI